MSTWSTAPPIDGLAILRTIKGTRAADDIYTWRILEHLDWALSRAAAPCPPLSASGQLEHTLATAYRDPARAELVAHQSAMKGRG